MLYNQKYTKSANVSTNEASVNAFIIGLLILSLLTEEKSLNKATRKSLFFCQFFINKIKKHNYDETTKSDVF
jgi:hypothetical protein